MLLALVKDICTGGRVVALNIATADSLGTDDQSRAPTNSPPPS
jgi:hypothetical protein